MSNKTDTTNGNQEKSFSILPHPATTNDPADLQGTINPADLHKFQQGGLGALSTPGPVIPNNLPEPRSREELEVAQKQLNQAQSNSKE